MRVRSGQSFRLVREKHDPTLRPPHREAETYLATHDLDAQQALTELAWNVLERLGPNRLVLEDPLSWTEILAEATPQELTQVGLVKLHVAEKPTLYLSDNEDLREELLGSCAQCGRPGPLDVEQLCHRCRIRDAEGNTIDAGHHGALLCPACLATMTPILDGAEHACPTCGLRSDQPLPMPKSNETPPTENSP